MSGSRARPALATPVQAQPDKPDLLDTLVHVAGNGEAGYSGDGGDARNVRIAGTGDHLSSPRRDEAGAKATEVGIGSPSDVAVAPDGSVYVASYGLYRIDPGDGTLSQVEPAKLGRLAMDAKLAIDRHGNVYFTDSTEHRVQVVVRPGEAEAGSTFPWGVILTILGIGAAGIVAFGVYRWRRKPADEVTTPA